MLKRLTAAFSILLMLAPQMSVAGGNSKANKRSDCGELLLPKASQTLEIVRRALGDGFKAWRLNDFNSARVTTWPSGDENEAMRLGLLNLSQGQRTKLQAEVKAQFPDAKQIPVMFAILLDPADEVSWLRLFELTTVPSAENFRLSGNFLNNTFKLLGPVLTDMPLSARERILQLIATRYPEAGKNSERNFLAYGPKRAMDLWLRIFIPSDQIFAAALKKTKNPLKAFQAYLDAVKTELIARMPLNDLLYGSLSAQDILKFAVVAQKSLQEAGYRDEQTRICFHGSVMKGMSKRQSDFDVLTLGLSSPAYGKSLPPGYPAFSLSQENNSTLSGTPADNMRILAEKIHPELALQLSNPHTFEDKKYYIYEIGGMSLLEPFMIEVTPKKIDLLMMPSRNEDGLFWPIKETDCDNGINCIRYNLKSAS